MRLIIQLANAPSKWDVEGQNCSEEEEEGREKTNRGEGSAAAPELPGIPITG